MTREVFINIMRDLSQLADIANHLLLKGSLDRETSKDRYLNDVSAAFSDYKSATSVDTATPVSDAVKLSKAISSIIFNPDKQSDPDLIEYDVFLNALTNAIGVHVGFEQIHIFRDETDMDEMVLAFVDEPGSEKLTEIMTDSTVEKDWRITGEVDDGVRILSHSGSYESVVSYALSELPGSTVIHLEPTDEYSARKQREFDRGITQSPGLQF